MDIAKMMKQAQEMEGKMKEVQDGLAEKTVESSVGGGKITVTANGAGEVTAIKIDPAVIDPDDAEMLEDLVLTGVKQALTNAKELAAEEMGKVTAGMGLPPGLGL